jgi:hypothetical protein
MLPEALAVMIRLIPLLHFLAFYKYSPVSASAKIQISLIISAVAFYLYFPEAANATFSSGKGYILEHPMKSATIAVAIGTALKYLQQKFRYARINAIKKKYGFTDDPSTWEDMTVEQAQEIECNMAEWESPRLFQFGWVSDFLRVSNSPSPRREHADIEERLQPTQACLVPSLIPVIS